MLMVPELPHFRCTSSAEPSAIGRTTPHTATTS